ncbi:uncharacterized protein LOC34620614 [Cyclospora cayetanensis]|uniref:Uncharacterized protein LOC34620614 n=1 Tax=Cyclospora cayetanensis TaxID=88456 RepID=A0A6P6RXS1_9EIME|nr:uncharacterized protein LOC34620614 [Cyclospora cayetanensis]
MSPAMSPLLCLVFLLQCWEVHSFLRLWQQGTPRGHLGAVEEDNGSQGTSICCCAEQCVVFSMCAVDVPGAVVVSPNVAPLLPIDDLLAISDSTDNTEAAVLLFASWDSSSMMLLQTWRQAADSFQQSLRGGLSLFSLSSPSFFKKKCKAREQPLKTAAFDCAQQPQHDGHDARALCRSIGVSSLPALLYFTPKPVRFTEAQQHMQQNQLGLFDDEADATLNPRATRYKGDMLMKEAIVDWLKLLRCISRFQQLISSRSSRTSGQQLQQQLEQQEQLIQEQQQLLQKQQLELDNLRKQLQKPL